MMNCLNRIWLVHPCTRQHNLSGGGKVLRTTQHSRFVAALLGLRHILPPLRYGKTSAMLETLYAIAPPFAGIELLRRKPASVPVKT